MGPLTCTSSNHMSCYIFDDVIFPDVTRTVRVHNSFKQQLDKAGEPVFNLH